MYKDLLKNPLIRRLSVIQFLAYFGAWFSVVAIYTMILEFGVSAMTNALVVAMFSLPALLAPINGAVVDKFISKRFMIILLFVELFMTLMFLGIREKDDIAMLCVFIFVRTLASFLFFNSEMSLLPKILKSDELKKANELHSIIWSVTFALGISIGGLVVHKIGIYNTIIIDTIFFAVAVFIFRGVSFDVKKHTGVSIRSLIKDGFLYLRSDKRILMLILFHAVVAFTSFDAVINLLTDMNYKNVISIPLAIGFLNATRAVGLMIGPLVIGKRINASNLHIFFYLQGVVIGIWAFVQDSFYISLFMMFFIGFFTTTLWSFTYTLIQNRVKNQYLGRVLAYNEMVFMSTSVATTIFIGSAFEGGLSLFFITLILALAFLISGLFYNRWYHNI